VTTHPRAADTPEGFVPLFLTGPLLEALGPFFCRPRKSTLVIGLRIAAKHTSARGSAHGGLLLTLVDIALGYTASASSDPPLALTTADIVADFATLLPRGILNSDEKHGDFD
jgi:acyl-coenzyme A thioesterase PaaI-like protein